MTPVKPIPAPPAQVEPEYYSGDEGEEEVNDLRTADPDSDLEDLTDTPQGPGLASIVHLSIQIDAGMYCVLQNAGQGLPNCPK